MKHPGKTVFYELTGYSSFALKLLKFISKLGILLLGGSIFMKFIHLKKFVVLLVALASLNFLFINCSRSGSGPNEGSTPGDVTPPTNDDAAADSDSVVQPASAQKIDTGTNDMWVESFKPDYKTLDDMRLGPALSPDKRYLAYRQYKVGTGGSLLAPSLFLMNLQTRSVTQINPSNTAVSRVIITKDSSRLLYTSTEMNSSGDSANTYKLISLRLSDLSKTLVSPVGVKVGRFALSPDESLVGIVDNAGINRQLYLSRIDGSGSIHLTSGLTMAPEYGVGNNNSNGFEFTADGSRVVFYFGRYDRTELYSIRIDGTQLTKLNSTLVAGGQLNISTDGNYFSLCGDSQRLVYWGFQDSISQVAIYSVNIDGTNLKKISQSDPSANYNYGVQRYSNTVQIMKDCSRVMFSARFSATATELYSVNWDGTDQKKISDQTPFSTVYNTLLDPVTGKITFFKDSEKSYNYKLHSVMIDGSDFKSYGGVSSTNALYVSGVRTSPYNKNLVLLTARNNEGSVAKTFYVNTSGVGEMREIFSADSSVDTNLLTLNWAKNGDVYFLAKKSGKKNFSLYRYNGSDLKSSRRPVSSPNLDGLLLDENESTLFLNGNFNSVSDDSSSFYITKVSEYFSDL